MEGRESSISQADIVIVGGGVTGVGVALEASAWGFSVALLEKSRCLSATSRNSLRIIHGGLRYVQGFELGRMLESNREQAYWLEEAPAFMRPLACVMPLAAYGMRSAVPARAACLLYNALGRGRAPDLRARVMSKRQAARTFASFADQCEHGALVWHDVLLEDPDGFAAYLVARARRQGAVICEESRVSEIRRCDRGFAVFALEDGGVRKEIRTSVVVSAAGPWMHEVASLIEGSPRWNPRLWCLAFNVIVERQLHEQAAFACRSSRGRNLFFVPRGTHMAIGTWYIPWESGAEHAAVPEEACREFLCEANAAVPHADFGKVLGIECGVLPMRRLGPQGPELYGDHEVQVQDGFVHVMSTKYTTFRSLAKKVLRAAAPWLG